MANGKEVESYDDVHVGSTYCFKKYYVLVDNTLT